MSILLKKIGNKLIQKFFLTKEELFKRKMLALPRFTTTEVPFLDKKLQVVDAMSFWNAYEEIFLNGRYIFNTKHDNPIIIDAGANIGLASIFLNQLYPHANIYAFEPDPKIFDTLNKNITEYCNGNVTLLQLGLWKENTIIKFHQEGADGGRLSDDTKIESIDINVVKLTDYLKEPVAFLKMDIEGAEYEVLKSCQELLDKVENIFIEYHSFSDSPQTVDEIFKILLSAGFRINSLTDGNLKSPLINSKKSYMDMQLNIFGYRP